MTEQQTLSLKELEPYEYLDLEIKCIDKGDGRYGETFTVTEFNTHKYHGFVAICGYNSFYPHEFKPILKPLSKVKDGMIAYYGYPNREMFEEDVRNKTISVLIWNELLDNHFDVFGLLEKGSAIEKTT
nr:hypothetical protein [uncultured Allomuricauda sp.]